MSISGFCRYNSGKKCPSYDVKYTDSPADAGSEFGWYQDMINVENSTTNEISEKVVGNITIVGSNKSAVVNYSTYQPVITADSCSTEGVSRVIGPNVYNGGQSTSRFYGTDSFRIINVGYSLSSSFPNGELPPLVEKHLGLVM